MRLVKDWKWVIYKAWSARLMIVAAVLSAIEVALPYLDGYLPVHPGVFAAASGIATGGAFIARIIAQREDS